VQVDLNIFKPYLALITKDERITVWHVAMFWGIILLATSSDPTSPIRISRRKLMRLSHIGNFMTYHKCIKELEDFGYISYSPSYNPELGSKILIKGI